MTDIKKNAARLRDECERLAQLAERRTTDPALTDAERHAAIEDAKIFWQLSRVHADDVANLEAERPTKFSGQNTGEQNKTTVRLSFLVGIKVEGETRQRFAERACKDPNNKGLFKTVDAALNFINRMKL